MSNVIPYYFLKLFFRLRQFLILFLMVYITAVPVINSIFHQLDLNYEQCEIDREEDPKEKEILVDELDDEDQKLFSLHNLSSIYCDKLFAEYNPSIQLPPPKKV